MNYFKSKISSCLHIQEQCLLGPFYTTFKREFETIQINYFFIFFLLPECRHLESEEETSIQPEAGRYKYRCCMFLLDMTSLKRNRRMKDKKYSQNKKTIGNKLICRNQRLI